MSVKSCTMNYVISITDCLNEWDSESMGYQNLVIGAHFLFPAGIFDSGSVLLNQNVNGCARTDMNHNRTVAERISKNIGSGFVQDSFGPEQIIIGSRLVRTSFRACRVTLLCPRATSSSKLCTRGVCF